MANVEMILRVADAIEAAAKPNAKPEFGFNMASFVGEDDEDLTGHHCGTVGCIAGWAVYVDGGAEAVKTTDYDDVPIRAQKLMGLDEITAHGLFYPGFASMDTIQPTQAVDVLRNLVATGKVDWSSAA